MRPVILCIDDEEKFLTPLVQQLHRSLGDSYDIEFANSIDEVLGLLQILKTEDIELPLVILDQQLPEPESGALLIEIRQHFSYALSISLTEQKSVESQVTDPEHLHRCLSKPWNETELLLTVKEALRSYQQQQELIIYRQETLRANDRSTNSRALLQATLDATVDGILALDCYGQITHFNQALLDLFAPQSWSAQTAQDDAPTRLRPDELRDFSEDNGLQAYQERMIPQLRQWLQDAPQVWEHLMAQSFTPQSPQGPTETAVAIAIAEVNQARINQARINQAKINQARANPAKSDPAISIDLVNGRKLEYQSQLQRVGNSIVGQVWSFHDVTERQRNETLIRYQAHHDFLTGIANRFKFNDVLDDMLLRAAASETQLAVLFIDLDRFKVVNDSLGHSIGDQLLKSLVQRLQRICRPDELIARWGGDEFTMVVGNLAHASEAAQAARRILSALQRPFEVQGHQLRMNVSIGISQYPEDGTTAEQLLKRADMALYQVKEEGRNGYQHYHPQLDSQGQTLFAIESALHKALEHNELSLHYQPQLDSDTGQITHMEALLRWQHPSLGNISPQQFIAVAEQNGLIFSLGEWVLTEACHQAKRWQSMGLPNLTMCVNLSPLQLSHANLPELIQQVLTTTSLAAEWLELEITESAALRNEHVIKDVLDSLQQLGLGLALDDFGTGYSSLSYAKELPFDTLKLDQSFVRDLMTNHSDGVIVQAVLAMGKGLQRRVVAEGVETEELRALLQSWGCRYLQGYWFSQPLPAEAATKFLIARQAGLVQAV